MTPDDHGGQEHTGDITQNVWIADDTTDQSGLVYHWNRQMTLIEKVTLPLIRGAQDD